MGNTEDGHEQTALERFLLRDGFQSPWTEAMSKTRWKPWVWIAWQVSRVALAVLAVVLIGFGINAVVDRQEAMEASAVIALTVVLVTGVGAVFTVAANVWLGRKRLASEERRHTERLAHERREAVRSTAAAAYSKASDVLYQVNTNTIHKIAATSEFALPDEINQSKIEALQALSLVRALGWTKEVQDRALLLNLELLRFLKVTFAVAGVIRSNQPTEAKAMGKYEAQETKALEALELYRMEITK